MERKHPLQITEGQGRSTQRKLKAPAAKVKTLLEVPIKIVFSKLSIAGEFLVYILTPFKMITHMGKIRKTVFGLARAELARHLEELVTSEPLYPSPIRDNFVAVFETTIIAILSFDSERDEYLVQWKMPDDPDDIVCPTISGDDWNGATYLFSIRLDGIVQTLMEKTGLDPKVILEKEIE